MQHELMPRVALDVGYFRRIWKNFQVTDNLLLAPEDFTQFSMTVPTDPRLPTRRLDARPGFYNVMPDEVRAGRRT